MAITNENGWWINAKGEAVHPDLVRVTDKLKDETVSDLLNGAENLSQTIADFKGMAFGMVEDYFNLLLQEYGVDEKSKRKKANFTLENYSSTMKVEVRVAEVLQFDEKIQVAKHKVDEYLKKATKGASPEIQTLITKAFEVDKQGNIDAKKVFALKSYDITDPLWVEAMSIIDEAKRIVSTRNYIRFYSRPDTNEAWKLVPLDIAGVEAKKTGTVCISHDGPVQTVEGVVNG